jgi:hypothetical protein
MCRRIAISLLTALAALAIASPATAEGAGDAPATVTLPESVQVGGDALTLARLAEIAPAESAEALGEVAIGPAPLPGDSRRLTRGYLKMRLRRAGVACSEITFAGADTVEVRRAPTPAVTQRPDQGEVEAADPPGARRPAQPLTTVDRGTRVRLIVRCGAVSVGAEAVLLEDGVVGGRTKMRVEQTRETVVAQIVQPSEAVIRRE